MICLLPRGIGLRSPYIYCQGRNKPLLFISTTCHSLLHGDVLQQLKHIIMYDTSKALDIILCIKGCYFAKTRRKQNFEISRSCKVKNEGLSVNYELYLESLLQCC